MFTSIKQFLDVWESETASTLSVFNNLTDESHLKWFQNLVLKTSGFH